MLVDCILHTRATATSAHQGPGYDRIKWLLSSHAFARARHPSPFTHNPSPVTRHPSPVPASAIRIATSTVPASVTRTVTSTVTAAHRLSPVIYHPSPVTRCPPSTTRAPAAPPSGARYGPVRPSRYTRLSLPISRLLDDYSENRTTRSR